MTNRTKPHRPSWLRSAIAAVLVVGGLAVNVVDSKPAHAQTFYCGGAVWAFNPGAYLIVTQGEVYCNGPTQYITMNSNWYVYNYTTGSATLQAVNPQWSFGSSQLIWNDYFNGSPWLRFNQVCGAGVPVGGVGYYACPGNIGWF